MISSEEVKKIALLARIELDKRESEELQKDLGVILDYVSTLQKAPVRDTGSSASSQTKAPEILNIFREDEPVKDDSDIKKGEHAKVKHIL